MEVDALESRADRRARLDITRHPSVYEDGGLEANTVYLYRVKVIYTAGGGTAYAEEGAGKTLPAGATQSGTVQVCTRNSLCEVKPKFSIFAPPSLPRTSVPTIPSVAMWEPRASSSRRGE